MTATFLDQVTMLRRNGRTDLDDPDPLRNDVRGGYRSRNGSAAHDGDTTHDGEPPMPTDPMLPTGRAWWKDAAPRRRSAHSYLASVVDIAPVLPTVGAIATVFAYVGGPTALAAQVHQLPLIIGAASTVLLGLATAYLHRLLFTAPEQAHPRSFAELRQRVDTLGTQVDVLVADITHQTPASQRLAFGEAVAHYRTLDRDLARSGPQWTIGTGYVDAISRLHRAEEALIAVQPATDVLAGALYDELRIAGSTMADREHLLEKLRMAVQALRPSATAYLNESPCGRSRHAGAGQSQRTAPAAGAAPTGQPAGAAAGPHPAAVSATNARCAEAEARIVLREVRRALNEFRDESRARLVRSRSRLLGTMTLTGAITYVLLAFAVNLDGRPEIAFNNPIVAAAAIYLVGAVVGLFNRLHVESGDDAAGEDYGLSKTRLLLTPMLSGLAAVGGVMITGMLSGIVDVNMLTPTPAAAADLGSKTFEIGPNGQIGRIGLTLHDVFNLRDYPFSLVLAATFGLAPKMLLKRLHQATEQSRLDLKSTAASHQASGGRRGKSTDGTD